MRKEIIVQFVFFQSILDSEEFITEWENYTRSANHDRVLRFDNWDVAIHQCRKKNGFRYIIEHRSAADPSGLKYINEKRATRTDKVEIKGDQAGGYTILQDERPADTGPGESRVFAFISDPAADLNKFRDLQQSFPLNIYQAYFESCRYEYILEYFVPDEFTEELKLQLKQLAAVEAGIYKECVLEVS